jgi:hypothetical protein
MPITDGLLIERLQFIKGLDPIADAHNGAPGGDVIDMAPFSRIVALMYRGVATGGTAAPTYTVEACDDVVPTTQSAIPFHYRKSYGAVTLATATGFQATAGSSAIDVLEIREDALAASGYRYVRVKVAETVNDPVVACIVYLGELKVARDTWATVTD